MFVLAAYGSFAALSPAEICLPTSQLPIDLVRASIAKPSAPFERATYLHDRLMHLGVVAVSALDAVDGSSTGR
jgi:hypothetical protein